MREKGKRASVERLLKTGDTDPSLMTSPTARELALDPEWIPHAFDEGGAQLTSVLVPIEARNSLVFLTDGQFRGAFQKASAPATRVKDEAAALNEAPIHFVFHSSFCCSTLLAKALAQPRVSTSLSEPNILVNVADQTNETSLVSEMKLDLALRLLARPFENSEAIVVKPSSFANRLIEPILQLRPNARGVLLYSDAETFLSSVVRRGLLGRINARKLYRNLASWTKLRFGFSDLEIFEQTDLQIAALAWLMQIAHFDRLARDLGKDRLIVLDAAKLLASPAVELERVQSFFGLGLSGPQIHAIVGGPVFSKHSKSADRDYDANARKDDRIAVLKDHREELDMVLQWLGAVRDHLGVPARPGSAV